MKVGLPFYKQILDNLSEGVYFVDRNRKILYWNNGAERISGYSADEVKGSHCYDNILVHVDLKGNSLCHGPCPLVRAIRDDTRIETEAFLRHKSGHRVPVLIRTAPVHDTGGEITGAVEVFSENSTRIALQEDIHRLEQMSLLDPLTGLANRRYLDMSLKSHMDQMRRYQWQFGVLFADIDNFKSVNDTFGHQVGDQILTMVARTIGGNSRSFDVAGRWGGEEFLVIGNHVTPQSLREIADRYRVLVEASAIPIQNGMFHVTVSIGATVARPDDTIKTLVDRVDRLMYESKKAGKNRVTSA